MVGEFAAWLALKGGGKTFYTTPIKALSNQKYGDFVALYGADNVGLLTGDNSINGDAPIVVMTTEVLRNMIYEDSPTLHGLRYVVLDEVHYLQDRYRGAVWEEVLIHLPVDVQIVSLSATVSNAEEFAEWLQTLRGRPRSSSRRSGRSRSVTGTWRPTSCCRCSSRSPDGTSIPNPRGRGVRHEAGAGARPAAGPRGPASSSKRARIPWRTEVVDRLDVGGHAAGDLLHLLSQGVRRSREAVPPRERRA